MTLSDDELKILEAAKEANPWYFKALLLGATVVPQRRRKYSGKQHPFVNFEIAARIMGASPDDCFRWYIALKEARSEMATGNFDDESELDTLRDQMNYVALRLGYKLFRAENTLGEQALSKRLSLAQAEITRLKELLDE